MVDVSETPVASGARDQWQQQWCDWLQCHEEWCGSVSSSVVVFSWVLDKHGVAGTCSCRQHLLSALAVQHGAVLLHQCYMPQWTLLSQHTVWGALSLDEENWDVSLHLIDISSLFHMREPWFHPSDDLSKKVITFHLILVLQGLCNCIAVPLFHLEISWGVQCAASCGNPECHAECGAQFSDKLQLLLLTHAQSIGNQHPTGKRGVELCCSSHGVILYVDCPEQHPCLSGMPNPLCHCALWECCIATCFMQSLKTFLCTMASCHFNFDPGTLLSFCKHGLGALALSLWKSAFYTLQ